MLYFLETFAGFETTGTNTNDTDAAVATHADFLKIGQETPLGQIMGVTNVVPYHRLLAADFALTCHIIPPIY